jgi:hypothetical protein
MHIDFACTSKHNVSMNRMDTARRAQVIRCLIEGNSINSTVRMTGVAKNTVLKLLVEIGSACSDYMDRSMRNLNCQRLQADAECRMFAPDSRSLRDAQRVNRRIDMRMVETEPIPDVANVGVIGR